MSFNEYDMPYRQEQLLRDSSPEGYGRSRFYGYAQWLQRIFSTVSPERFETEQPPRDASPEEAHISPPSTRKAS